MKRKLAETLRIVLIFWGISLLSCAGMNIDPAGYWTSPEAYRTWKSGPTEDLVATKAKVGNRVYLALPNSTLVDTLSDQKVLHVPGARWKITGFRQVSDSKVIIELDSFSDKQANAELSMNFVNEDEFYFGVETMNDSFKEEFKQSFLEPGSDFLYYRCDRLK